MRLQICAAISAFALFLLAAGCSNSTRVVNPPNWQQQAARGKSLVRSYGCDTCHDIPEIEGYRGSIGPSLQHIATRYYLAGQIPNSSENLRRWIQRPHEISPQTVMPDMNVTDADAADIALFLETLN